MWAVGGFRGYGGSVWVMGEWVVSQWIVDGLDLANNIGSLTVSSAFLQ